MTIFNYYVQPGVYVRTLRRLAAATALPGLRLPLLIGEGAETVPIVGLAVPRATSRSIDNLVKSENVSARFIDPQTQNLGDVNGQRKAFRVKNLPIVNGNGSGTITNEPSDITVTINGEPAAVLSVNGTTGVVTLNQIPIEGDMVKVTYSYDRRDTLIEDENLSYQVDGTAVLFKVNFPRIVIGNNGGESTTNVANITVKVNGVRVTPTSVNGTAGTFTLATAPANGSVLTVTYYSNNLEDTGDPLPETSISKINAIGNSPGRSDYVNGIDYTLFNDQIYWGNAFAVTLGVNSNGNTVFDESRIQLTQVDNTFYFEEMTGVTDGVNKVFTSRSAPTDGAGNGKPTDDSSKVKVYVGTDPQTALAAGPVVVSNLQGANRQYTLLEAPTSGANVYVTYFYNQNTDAQYEVVNTLAGATGVGTYKVTSTAFGDLAVIAEGAHSVQDVMFSVSGIAFPDDNPDMFVSPGIAVTEEITVTFDTATTFTVTSDNAFGSAGNGRLGQTYVDARTGFRFTALDSQTISGYPNPYAFQNGDTLIFTVEVGGDIETATTPYLNIPGHWLVVEDTEDLTVEDSVIINTFSRLGREPVVGATYFVDYEFDKVEFGPFLVSNERDLIAAIGEVNLNNRLSLAARLAFQNGATQIAVLQLPRAAGQPVAAPSAYIEAIAAQSERLVNDRNQDVIVPLTGDADVWGFLKQHVQEQSSENFNNPRIGIVGYDLGTSVDTMISTNKSLFSDRVWTNTAAGAILALRNAAGRDVENPVDGCYVAAAIAGLICAPSFDSAQPFVNKQLVGFRRLLVRSYNRQTAGDLAQSGTFLLKDVGTAIEIVDAYTTQYGTLNTEEPNVVLVADEINKQLRLVVKPFIGKKSLSGLEAAIAEKVSRLMESKLNVIISEYTQPIVEIDEEDTRRGYISVGFKTIYALKWILATLDIL